MSKLSFSHIYGGIIIISTFLSLVSSVISFSEKLFGGFFVVFYFIFVIASFMITPYLDNFYYDIGDKARYFKVMNSTVKLLSILISGRIIINIAGIEGILGVITSVGGTIFYIILSLFLLGFNLHAVWEKS